MQGGQLGEFIVIKGRNDDGLQKGCNSEVKKHIQNTSGEEPIGLTDELIWNTREEKNQDLPLKAKKIKDLDFWPEELDRW